MVHDFVADEAQPFIVMEYIDGDTLGKRLRDEPPLTLDAALALLESCVPAWPTRTRRASSIATSSRPT